VPATSGLLPRIRYAQDFEALRDRSDAASERPKVFLAALGPFAAHSARVSFASNLFQAGGIEPVVGSGNADDMVAEFTASGTPVVCLCSSDKIYSETAQWVAKALREAGAEYVWLAGKPDQEIPGVDGYLYTGCDALQVLRSTLEMAGVTA
jgi:methylmalonyl-CoA mutase